MTSKATEKDTVEHLKKIVPECGLDENQLTIFSQNDFPCFNMDGNLILSTKSSIATSPGCCLLKWESDVYGNFFGRSENKKVG